MNSYIAICRATKDIEEAYSKDGKCIVKLGIAVSKRFHKDGEPDADFFDCVAFGKVAEGMAKCKIAKGTKLAIEGEVHNNNYTDKNGNKVYGTQIQINNFEFVESKKENQDNAPAAPADKDGFMNVDASIDADLPFN